MAIGPIADGMTDDDVDIEEENKPSLPASSFLGTVMKLLRKLPCSEEQSQSFRELQDFLADHQLSRLHHSSITNFFSMLANIEVYLPLLLYVY